MKRLIRDLLSLLLVSAFLIVAGLSFGITQGTQAGAAATGQATGPKAPAKKAERRLARAQNLSGTITMFSKENGLLVLTGSNGVPYSFRVTKLTQVKVDGKFAKLEDLSDHLNKQATIEFVPMSTGNFANVMEVAGR